MFRVYSEREGDPSRHSFFLPVTVQSPLMAVELNSKEIKANRTCRGRRPLTGQ